MKSNKNKDITICFDLDKPLFILAKSKIIDFLNWLKYDVKGAVKPRIKTVAGLKATLYYDKKNKTYFIQAKDDPNIYTAAKSPEELAKSFHDIVNYHLENPRYMIRKNDFEMEFPDEVIQQAHKKGQVNVSPRVCSA